MNRLISIFSKSRVSNSITSIRRSWYSSFYKISTSTSLNSYIKFSINGNKDKRKTQSLNLNRQKVEGNVVFIGCGAVALCCMDLLDRFIDVTWDKVIMIDMLDLEPKLKPYIEKGACFKKELITPENYNEIFGKYTKKGDVVIDLTVDSGSLEFMKWCQTNGVFYINSSIESWHSQNPTEFDPVKQCQFYEFDSTELWKKKMREQRPDLNTTIIYGLGANPGLVNLFCKKNLEDIAVYYIKNNDNRSALSQSIAHFLKKKQWNKLSQTLGVKTIHISERDTQYPSLVNAKKPGECVNTWSIEGMYYEWIFLQSEIGWGTHEKLLPPGARHIDIDPFRGPSHVILLPERGVGAAIRSWCPLGEYIGHTVTHEENYEICLDLTVMEEGKVVYRPTVNFAYRPSNSCMKSLEEILQTPGRLLQEKKRILSSEIVAGNDLLGVFTMGHLYNGWWTGSLLDILETREIVGDKHNATTLQVAVGVMSGVVWMLKNPKAGILCPTELPHDEILPMAYPFLGPFISIPVLWKPNNETQWQFSDFTVNPQFKFK